jgi:phenylpropionate dioxygenase-like ring-hydroxylating dioxygenase large terminal subunit
MTTHYVEDRSADGLFRVRTEVFRDQAIFDAERRLIFDRSWLYVGHESEVTEPGSFVTRSVGGHPIIMVRGRDGEVRVLFNTCAHQGSRVCRVPSGTADSFQCFFHGWTYDTDGKLIRVPGDSSYLKEFTKETHGLAAPRVGSYRGFVFMCSSPQTADLPDYLGPAREYLDLVADQADEMIVVPGSHKYATHGNWKMVTMNGNDGYHVATTHATYLKYLRNEGVDTGARRLGRRPNLGNGHTASEFFGGWGRPVARWAPYWTDDIKPLLEAKREELHEKFGTERGTLMADVDRNLIVFPNLVINDHSSIIIRTWEPIAPGKVVVSAWCIAPKDEDPRLRALRLRNYLTFFGPAGFATPDDIEALDGAQLAFQNDAMQWLDVSKGAATEDDPDVADNADENQLRAFWRRWQSDMSAADETAEVPFHG